MHSPHASFCVLATKCNLMLVGDSFNIYKQLKKKYTFSHNQLRFRFLPFFSQVQFGHFLSLKPSAVLGNSEKYPYSLGDQKDFREKVTTIQWYRSRWYLCLSRSLSPLQDRSLRLRDFPAHSLSKESSLSRSRLRSRSRPRSLSSSLERLSTLGETK